MYWNDDDSFEDFWIPFHILDSSIPWSDPQKSFQICFLQRTQNTRQSFLEKKMHNVNDLKLIQSTMSESYLSACQCTLFRCCRSALFRLKAWSQRVHLNRLISEWTSNMWRLMLLRLWNSFPQTGHRKSASPNESNFPLCKGSPKEKKQRLRTLYFWEISGLICKLDHVTKYVSNQIPISKKKKSILLNQFSLRPKTQPYIVHAIYWKRKICSVHTTTLLFFLSVFYAH